MDSRNLAEHLPNLTIQTNLWRIMSLIVVFAKYRFQYTLLRCLYQRIGRCDHQNDAKNGDPNEEGTFSMMQLLRWYRIRTLRDKQRYWFMRSACSSSASNWWRRRSTSRAWIQVLHSSRFRNKAVRVRGERRTGEIVKAYIEKTNSTACVELSQTVELIGKPEWRRRHVKERNMLSCQPRIIFTWKRNDEGQPSYTR